jgi:hypothetical protein
MPPEGIMEEKLKNSLASSGSQGSLHDSYHNLSPRIEHQQQHDIFEKPPVRPVRAANRVLTEDFGNNNDYRSNSPMPTRAMSTIPTQKFIEEEEEEFEDKDIVRDYYLTKFVSYTNNTIIIATTKLGTQNDTQRKVLLL